MSMGHSGSRTAAGFKVALGKQLLIRLKHGAAGHTQLFAQQAGGGQPVASGQVAAQDEGLDLAAYLAAQRKGALRIKG
jgi:hypothetical protein